MLFKSVCNFFLRIDLVFIRASSNRIDLSSSLEDNSYWHSRIYIFLVYLINYFNTLIPMSNWFKDDWLILVQVIAINSWLIIYWFNKTLNIAMSAMTALTVTGFQLVLEHVRRPPLHISLLQSDPLVTVARFYAIFYELSFLYMIFRASCE